MINFLLKIKSLTGEEWEIPYSSFSFTEELNNDKSATVTLDFEVVEPVATTYNVTVEYILTASFRELYIYDGTTKLYGGYIAEVSYQAGGNEKGTISITSKGFFSLFDKRFTDDGTICSYSSTDASDIAWNLLNYSQGLSFGDFGIVRGATGIPTKDRDRNCKYDNIADTIRKLSNTNVKDGFDFEITSDKVFNVYYPQAGTQKSNVIFEADFNIASFSIIRTFVDGMVNQVIVGGNGQGEGQLISVRDADSSYKSSFYLLQDKISETDVFDSTTLDDKGDKYLDLYKYPRNFIQSLETHYDEPLFSSYILGDSVKIKIPSFNINDFFRVYKRTVKHDKTVVLEFQTL